MCVNDMSALELKKRGNLLVKLGYAISAGVFSALLGRTGYDAIVSGKLNDYYLVFLIACVLLIYYTVKKGIVYQERATQLENGTGEIAHSLSTTSTPSIQDEKLVVIDVVSSTMKINIRIEKI